MFIQFTFVNTDNQTFIFIFIYRYDL